MPSAYPPAMVATISVEDSSSRGSCRVGSCLLKEPWTPLQKSINLSLIRLLMKDLP